jgi:hypothetical protein
MDSKVHYRAHKDPPLAPILCQMNAVHILTSYYSQSILILFSHPRQSLTSNLFSSELLTKIVLASLICAVRTTFLAHPTLRD